MRLRCDALASVPIHITNRAGKDVPWPWPVRLADLLWRTEAGLLLTGGAYWLKLTNKVRTLGVQVLNPFTVTVEYQDGALRFRQQGDGNNSPWGAEQVVYFREFSPLDDLGPGIGAVEAALQDARLLHYMDRFASHFFEQGAMPLTILGFESVPSREEAERVEGWFRRQASSVANAFRVMALRANMNVHTITPPIKDLVMPELNAQARQAVAMAFGIPITMLEDAANYATAAEHRLSFWQDTVRPRGALIQDTINEQLLKPLGLRLEFAFDELSVFQADEAERAGALAQLTASGIDLLTAMELLGYKLTDEQLARLPAAAQDAGPAADSLPQALRMWERKAVRRVKDGKAAACEFEHASIPASLAAAVGGALAATEDVAGVRRAFASATTWREYP
jgi:HK97 family phage portal protein